MWRRMGTFVVCAVAALSGSLAQAQTFGIELHNNLMPASGGMAGASLSRPQDLQSAINGNPATLRQFQGTQFSFGGAWADANYHVDQSAPLPLLGVTTFDATSDTLGARCWVVGQSNQEACFSVACCISLPAATRRCLRWPKRP